LTVTKRNEKRIQEKDTTLFWEVLKEKQNGIEFEINYLEKSEFQKF
jgi:hypothetical protein